MVESTFHNLPRFVRLRSIRQVHPDRPMVASFSTDSYSITADLEVDPESPAVDGKQRGRLLQVYMESRKKETATLRALGGTVAFQPGYLACTRLMETPNYFAALDSICLLFYRTDTVTQGESEAKRNNPLQLEHVGAVVKIVDDILWS